MGENELIKIDDIQSRIYTIRGMQVMLDKDLADFFGIETKVLNQSVKRNEERFPERFRFRLTENEYRSLRSQFVTLESNKPESITKLLGVRGQHRKYVPYVFTEQGVAMLSAVLKSKTAVDISIQIMDAFVAMRHLLMTNAQIFQRIGTLEIKQIETDSKIEKILTAIEQKQIQPKQGIFFDGQIFDAHKFVSDIIRSAERSIILIDNFVDESTLTLFSKKGKGVDLKIITKTVSKEMELDARKFNEQFGGLKVVQYAKSHDRFLIIDDFTVYHLGASLKDLGKKWFAFSKMEIEADFLLSKISEF
ncbi:MAG TPA: ORF6N domain-containing protein [bacterium]|nr:ORF6N domain-containing protein [bacterium]